MLMPNFGSILFTSNTSNQMKKCTRKCVGHFCSEINVDQQIFALISMKIRLQSNQSAVNKPRRPVYVCAMHPRRTTRESDEDCGTDTSCRLLSCSNQTRLPQPNLYCLHVCNGTVRKQPPVVCACVRRNYEQGRRASGVRATIRCALSYLFLCSFACSVSFSLSRARASQSLRQRASVNNDGLESDHSDAGWRLLWVNRGRLFAYDFRILTALISTEIQKILFWISLNVSLSRAKRFETKRHSET